MAITSVADLPIVSVLRLRWDQQGPSALGASTLEADTVDMTKNGNAIQTQLRALADLVAMAPWPPWNEGSFDPLMQRLRGALDDEISGPDDLLAYAMAADDEVLQHWVTELIEPVDGVPVAAETVAALVALLRVYLLNDELACLGRLAALAGAPEPASMSAFEGVLADGG